MRLATLYHEDFSTTDCLYLPQQLNNFIVNVRCDPRFSTITNLGDLARKMVNTVATASVERAFSAMKIVKTDLRNRMGDEWLNDSLVVYIEKEIFSTIDNEQILQRFQSIDTRRYQLPPLPH
ncbi:hypothetical protein C2S52_015167 [Perilla frutescens var. hirtella]|nr:hypothetical protein C2S52_015167 [Perilla frutescens var. hirtella]KAH6816015.1 hypothetical protein C2S51_020835 [Perilla frutescens var. frutescens]